MLHGQLLIVCDKTARKGGSLIFIPTFTHAVERWDCADNLKYLSSIDRLFKRAFKLNNCIELFFTENIFALKDNYGTRSVTEIQLVLSMTCYHQNQQWLGYVRDITTISVPFIRTERFKGTVVNRCLFSS